MKHNNKIIHEKNTAVAMIELYCNRNHNTKKQLCSECIELKEYALACLDRCKFGNNKTSCRDCKIHCYKKDMKEKIIKVMRYSGPRMIIYHPTMAIEHLISKLNK